MENYVHEAEYQVGLEYKKNSKLICLQPYTVTKVHEEMFNKQVEHLVILEVLKNPNNSELRYPYFVYSKPKTN